MAQNCFRILCAYIMILLPTCAISSILDTSHYHQTIPILYQRSKNQEVYTEAQTYYMFRSCTGEPFMPPGSQLWTILLLESEEPDRHSASLPVLGLEKSKNLQNTEFLKTLLIFKAPEYYDIYITLHSIYLPYKILQNICHFIIIQSDQYDVDNNSGQRMCDVIFREPWSIQTIS